MFQQHTMVSPTQTPNFVLPRCLEEKTERGRTLLQQVWYYLFDSLTFRQELSPFLQRSLSCPSFTQTAAPPHLSQGQHIDFCTRVVMVWYFSMRCRIQPCQHLLGTVNTTCHHSSRHQKENTDTSRPHYFTVLKHLNITAMQQRGNIPEPL